MDILLLPGMNLYSVQQDNPRVHLLGLFVCMFVGMKHNLQIHLTGIHRRNVLLM